MLIVQSPAPSTSKLVSGLAEKYSLLANSNDLKIYYGSTPLVSFQNDGNVGIGTASPDTNLDVEGAGLLVPIPNRLFV